MTFDGSTLGRAGMPGDEAVLAELINLAHDGFADCLWAGAARPGESPRGFGVRQVGDGESRFFYQNCFVYTGDDGAHQVIVSAMLVHLLPDEPTVIGPHTPAIHVPVRELWNLAPGSRMVEALAVFPQYRGHRLGQGMVGMGALSLGLFMEGRPWCTVIPDGNGQARDLFAAAGYKEVARRPIVRDGWTCESDEWVLLSNDSAGGLKLPA